jgi:hypothetical protein
LQRLRAWPRPSRLPCPPARSVPPNKEAGGNQLVSCKSVLLVEHPTAQATIMNALVDHVSRPTPPALRPPLLPCSLHGSLRATAHAPPHTHTPPTPHPPRLSWQPL